MDNDPKNQPARRPPTCEFLEGRVLLSAASTYIPTPNGVPGTIEAENYNTGGEGVGYHSLVKSNAGGVLRNDGVGISPTTDAGGGYFVGWNLVGEWMQYSANIADAGTYTLDLRVASLNGGTCHLSCDGAAVTGKITLPNTGGWQTWKTVSFANVNLPAGKHVLRLTFDTGVNPKIGIANVNWFRLRDNPGTSARTGWWRNAKYGLFIHWGLYSQLAGHWNGQTTAGLGEWIMKDLNIPESQYETVASKFDPTQFNAQAWVNLAKAAGMKYIVITAKHHDGFSMFNSATSSYNVVADTPWHEDPLAQLSAACKAAGIHFGVYYSIMDWHHPELATGTTGAGAKNSTDPAVVNYVHNVLEPQLRELITQYHPDILWFDGEWVPWWTEEYGRQVQEYVQSLSPGIIINNRVGKRTSADGDYDTPEQLIPTTEPAGRPWESAITLNNTWGYKDTDTAWKSAATVINDLADTASSGGNLLLNVGPTGAGVFPAASVSILDQVGNWLAVNGNAIYNTTKAPVTSQSWGKLTRNGNTLYAIIFNWPSGALHLNIAGSVKDVKLLAGGAAVGFTSASTGINLTLPKTMPQQPATVVQIDFNGTMRAV
jgi:alpha-L-fucosidase